MINYMKSECYRVFHGREVYRLAGILSALAICINLVLFAMNRVEPGFRYGTVRFSLNTLTGSLFSLLLAGLLVPAMLFGEEKKYGTLKNAVAYGISRKSIFLGKCMVSFIAAMFSLAILLTVYVGSAFLLLESAEAEPVRRLLEGVVFLLPSAVAALILAVAFLGWCSKELNAIVGWFAVIMGIPLACFYLGFKIDLLATVARWMPWNFIKNEVIVRFGSYDCLWDVPAGLARCLLAGLAGIILFILLGLWRSDKDEVK